MLMYSYLLFKQIYSVVPYFWSFQNRSLGELERGPAVFWIDKIRSHKSPLTERIGRQRDAGGGNANGQTKINLKLRFVIEISCYESSNTASDTKSILICPYR